MLVSNRVPVFNLVCLAARQGNVELMELVDGRTDGVIEYYITAFTVALDNKQDRILDYLVGLLGKYDECQRKMKAFLVSDPCGSIARYVIDMYEEEVFDRLGEDFIKHCEEAIKLREEIIEDF